jgi:hypothetical protein
MTSAEHYAINVAAFYALREGIDTNYPAKQFVAIAGGKIVADDADFDKLQEKLAALGLIGDPMTVLVERAGDPRPIPFAFPGTFTATVMGRPWPSNGTVTGGH